MWVGEILDGDLNPVQEYFLRGPSVKIGRSVDNTLVFAADKSISRVHAEIVIDNAACTVHIVDLASRYGSSVNGARLDGNAPFKVEHGTVARFGVSNVRIRFTKRTYLYCTTRLDKTDKDKLKRCAKITGGRIVSQVEHATHVVANKAAATVKMLTALVVPLKMVRPEWLSFAEGTSPAELIPREEKFAPAPSDDVTVHDPKRSRSALLSSFVIFLVNAYDAQYAAICRACGATVIDCPREEEETGLSALEVITQHARSIASANTNSSSSSEGAAKDKFCVFFDESRGIDCDKILMNECREALIASGAQKSSRGDSMLTWLTAGQFAASIINFTPPTLLQDPPKASKVPGGGASASQSQFSAAGHSHLPSQSQSQFPPSPLVRAPLHTAHMQTPAVAAPLPLPVTKNVSVRETEEPERSLPPLPPSHAKQRAAAVAVSSHVPVRLDSARGGTFAEHTLAETSPAAGLSRQTTTAPAFGATTEGASSAHKMHPAARMMSVVKEEPVEAVREEKKAPVAPVVAVATLAADEWSSTSSKKRGREEEEKIENSVVPAASSGQSSSGGVSVAPQRRGKSLFLSEEDDEDDISRETQSLKRARPSGAGETHSAAVEVASPPPAAVRRVVPVHTLSLETAAPVPERRVAPVAASRAVSVRPAAQDTTDSAGWFVVLRGPDRTQAAQTKRNQAVEQLEKDREGDESESDEPRRLSLPQQAPVIEKNDLICAFIGDEAEPRRILNQHFSLSASSSSSSSSAARNVKIFRKNAVRTVGLRDRMSFTTKQLVLPKESERQIQLRLEADAREELERHADHMMSEKFAATSKRRAL